MWIIAVLWMYLMKSSSAAGQQKVFAVNIWMKTASGSAILCIHGLTAAQAEYNQYAPILMTSVDTDPKVCGEERKAILRRLGVGNWKIFGAHGSPKDYAVK